MFRITSICTLFCFLTIELFGYGAVLPGLDSNGPEAPGEILNHDDVTHGPIPGEPLNPSEFFEARSFVDNQERGQRIYQNEERYSQSLLLAERNGLIDERKRWPKTGDFVFIPYMISTKFDKRQRLIIVKAFEDFHENTCLRFVPRVNQKDYIYIIQGKGCDSDAGRMGGEQTVSLGPGCDYTDTAIHELNHAVGFWHEQNRPDRDNHITVLLNNVLPENRFNFDKMSPRAIHAYGQPYDTNSIMHYDKYAFSKDVKRLPVMIPKVPNDQMGLAPNLSPTDIAKIQQMYQCPSRQQHRPKPKPKAKTMEAELSDIDLFECQDLHQNCTLTARRDVDTSCRANVWIKANCRKSCETCDSCEDLNEECADWVSHGACESSKLRDYMKLYCPKSCSYCSSVLNNEI